MTKIDGLEIVMTEQIRNELIPEITEKYVKLLDMINMEVSQFNDGYDAAHEGTLETDHPHYEFDTDNWRLGYAWGAFEPMKKRIAELEEKSKAVCLWYCPYCGKLINEPGEEDETEDDDD